MTRPPGTRRPACLDGARSMDRDPLIATLNSQTISSASPMNVKVLMVRV